MASTAAEGGDGGGRKYRGVRKREWGKYVCEIRLPKSRERIWLGSHDTAEKAARAFDAALFCLRGRAANFNFPNDPPDIPGGEGLSPPEIQAVAQHYASSYGDRLQAEEDQAGAQAGPMDLVDRSFSEMVDMNGGHINAGFIDDFGLYSKPGEWYMDPQYVSRVCEDEEEGYDYGGLWNF